MNRIKQYLMVLLLGSTISCQEQEKVYFTADAPHAVVAGNAFNITYSLNAQVKNGAEPYLAETKSFVVVAGPIRSLSSSVEVVRPRLDADTPEKTVNKWKTSFTYTFQVNEAGDYIIPCCVLKTKNGTYQSNPLPITILSQEWDEL